MKRHFFLLVLLGTCLFIGTSCYPEKDEKLLLVSFDGFRHDYLSKTDTPNFDTLVENGVISEGLIPIFPSKTFPNYYAIATGLYPENNGFIGNSMYDPLTDEYFSMGNREAVENPDWYEGEPIWNTAEKQGKKAGTMFWVGSETPIQHMRPTHWKPYDGGMPDSARIDTVVKWLTYENELEVDFATLYFSFVDSRGHRHGPDSDEVIEAIQKADDLTGYLIESLKEAGIFEEINLLIASDHGMTDVSRERIIVLDDLVNTDELEIIEYSPTMMMNVKEEDKLEEIYTTLKENEEHYRVYEKNEIPERFHLKNHRRTPDLLMIADLGYTINTRDYFEERPDYPSGATHGYDNQEKEMHAIFMAHGPDFKNGYRMNAFQNIHLYELMTNLLHINPAPNDGSLDSISVILK